MRMRSVIFASGVLVFALTGAVEAATLVSPALPAPENGGFHCSVVNVGNKAQTVSVAMCDFTGVCDSAGPIERDPGQRTAFNLTAGSP